MKLQMMTTKAGIFESHFDNIKIFYWDLKNWILALLSISLKIQNSGGHKVSVLVIGRYIGFGQYIAFADIGNSLSVSVSADKKAHQ